MTKNQGADNRTENIELNVKNPHNTGRNHSGDHNWDCTDNHQFDPAEENKQNQNYRDKRIVD